MNVLIISGRLTKAPELSTISSGTALCKFAIANNGYGDKVVFLNCSAFGKTAEFIGQYFNKGDGVELSGELTQRIVEGDNGRVVYYGINVSSANFPICKKQDSGGQQSNNSQSNGSGAKPKNEPDMDNFDDDIPF